MRAARAHRNAAFNVASVTLSSRPPTYSVRLSLTAM